MIHIFEHGTALCKQQIELMPRYFYEICLIFLLRTCWVCSNSSSGSGEVLESGVCEIHHLFGLMNFLFS
jgi:hypothetical protein